MNKNELIETLASRLGTSRSEGEKVLNTFVDVITEVLKKGEEVNISGFGHFMVSHRAPRTGVNPQKPTEKIQIGATNVPKFRAGKNLKDAVRSSES
jgi:DNA-binding protein HU-beta